LVPALGRVELARSNSFHVGLVRDDHDDYPAAKFSLWRIFQLSTIGFSIAACRLDAELRGQLLSIPVIHATPMAVRTLPAFADCPSVPRRSSPVALPVHFECPLA
jgi:hypothetical protein